VINPNKTKEDPVVQEVTVTIEREEDIHNDRIFSLITFRFF